MYWSVFFVVVFIYVENVFVFMIGEFKLYCKFDYWRMFIDFFWVIGNKVVLLSNLIFDGDIEGNVFVDLFEVVCIFDVCKEGIVDKFFGVYIKCYSFKFWNELNVVRWVYYFVLIVKC